MRIRSPHIVLALTPVLFIVPTIVVGALGYDLIRREITRTVEEEVHVSLDASFGSVSLSKGESNKIVMAEFWRDEKEKLRLDMAYDITRKRGDLSISLTESKRKRYTIDAATSWDETREESERVDDRQLSVRFTDALPLSFNIGLGAGKGDFDFTGLQVQNLKLSSGASSVDLRCDEPNPVICETVTIESGVSKLTASNLSNLNFRKLKFSGGVGAYRLDFGGTLQTRAVAEVAVGLGAVTVLVPRDFPTRVVYDGSWFSSLDLDEGFMKIQKGVYETETFQSARRSLTIRIESGLGSVRVRSR